MGKAAPHSGAGRRLAPAVRPRFEPDAPMVYPLLPVSTREGDARMNSAWIGRRLMGASEALAERFAEQERAIAPGLPVAALAAPLLREAGRCLEQGETDPTLPLQRSRGEVRLPGPGGEQVLARAFNALMALVRDHLEQLPGSTEELIQQVLRAVRHAGRTLLTWRRELLAGRRTDALEPLYGGTVLLALPACRSGTA